MARKLSHSTVCDIQINRKLSQINSECTQKILLLLFRYSSSRYCSASVMSVSCIIKRRACMPMNGSNIPFNGMAASMHCVKGGKEHVNWIAEARSLIRMSGHFWIRPLTLIMKPRFRKRCKMPLKMSVLSSAKSFSRQRKSRWLRPCKLASYARSVFPQSSARDKYPVSNLGKEYCWQKASSFERL